MVEILPGNHASMKIHGPTLEEIAQREELMNMTATMMFGMQDKTGGDAYGAYMQSAERLQWENKQALQDILGNLEHYDQDPRVSWPAGSQESLYDQKLRITVETIQDSAVTIIRETIWLKERFLEGDNIWDLRNEVVGLITRIEALLRMQAEHPSLKALEGPLEDLWIELDAILETLDKTEVMLQ